MGIIKNRLLIKILKILESAIYKSADSIIGLAPGICDEISKKGISKSKDYASAALSNALTDGQNDDIAGYQLAMGIKSESPNTNISGTGGTTGAYTKEGLLLNQAQRDNITNQMEAQRLNQARDLSLAIPTTTPFFPFKFSIDIFFSCS